VIADLPAGRLVAASSAREAGAVFLIGVTIYLLCAPRSVMLDDDGYFILAAFFNGVAHPPGYPLYTLLAHLATRVPIGSVAFRVHALSGVFAALACACVWLFSMRLSRDRTVAWIASLCLAFSAAFWSQAIVAEVYTLNALLFFILCVLAITGDGSEDPGNGRSLDPSGSTHFRSRSGELPDRHRKLSSLWRQPHGRVERRYPNASPWAGSARN